MSPIDIVPMAPHDNDERFEDTTQPNLGYINQAFSMTEKSGSIPRPHHANGHSKQVSRLLNTNFSVNLKVLFLHLTFCYLCR